MVGKDFKKELRRLYSAKRSQIEEVDAPPLRYLMLDGRGDPSKAIGPVLGALYSVAYPLRYAIRERDKNLDYVVMPPEAIFHLAENGTLGPRDEWRWTMMILQPVEPTAREMDRVKSAAIARTGDQRIRDIRIQTLEEGRCVQTLHVGPYSEEEATIRRMQAYESEHGLTMAGPHHEVYLSDPNRVPPERVKTILRQPVAPAI